MPARRRHVYTSRNRPKYSARWSFKPKRKAIGGQVFAIMHDQEVSTTLGGVLQANFSINPTKAVNNVGTYVDFTSLAFLYQNYRVFKIKVTFTPKIPNDQGSLTFFQPCYAIWDADDGPTDYLTSRTDAISYPGARIKNLYKPWSVTYNVNQNGVGSSENVVFYKDGNYFKTDNPGNKGVIKIYADGLDSSTVYGTFTSKIYLRMRNRN